MDKPKKSFVSNATQDTDIKTEIKSKSDIDIYIENFNTLEKIAYEIAKSRLKTSFDIEKSIGYVKK